MSNLQFLYIKINYIDWSKVNNVGVDFVYSYYVISMLGLENVYRECLIMKQVQLCSFKFV